MKVTAQILHGMARAFFASAYADQADKCGQSLRGEILNQLPADMDRAAHHAACTLASDMEGTNGRDLYAIFAACQELPTDGADRDLTPELFGHYCAMQAMGHGVGLESFGDAVREAITVPYVEFGAYSLERDYFTSDDE